MPSIPNHIARNLRFPARPYQVAALQNWLDYMQQPADSIQLLFQMATGSGKTYIMAALMLDLYQRGYRNFLFFVNSLNILEKTRANFLYLESSKYLFTPTITINNRHVYIREVNNFNESDPTAINILFTTTQRLHKDLNQPHENRLTYHDLALEDIVLIGDEAHHNNAKSSRPEGDSWENTLAKILAANPHHLLLEFTATMDFTNPEIRSKYAKKLLYRYDLRQFRQDGYSKDVLLYLTSDDVHSRLLQALVISEYRRQVALKNHINLKPVILFKSRTITENHQNFQHFLDLTSHLEPKNLLELQRQAASQSSASAQFLLQAFDYFRCQGISLEKLCQILQQEFHPDRLLRVDGGQAIPVALQHRINTLEEPQNLIRALFVVDMLKEGWDVLNLFDIVRLYETKSHSSATLRATISDAQLIGRGARYYPFDFQNLPRYQRKFDNYLSAKYSSDELRVLEQLHYYSSHDIDYISDLKRELNASGLTDF